MAIAIVTSPENAISSLTDLVTVIRRRMDDDAFSADSIYGAIAEAEAVFNRELRCPKMETEYQFAVTGEETDLPNDFMQLRSVYQEGTPDRPLRSMSPDGLRKLFLGQAGIPQAYAIENRRLLIGPVGNTTLTILYYARIPSLTNDNPSNWLLEEHPDVYVRLVLAILFDEIGDDARAMNNERRAVAIIGSINESGKANRWGAAPLNPLGIQQVCGARL